MHASTVYTIGFVLLLIGLAAAAVLVGIPPTWIVIGALIGAGLGIMVGVVKMKRRGTVQTHIHRD
jgi:hypothetical protein